MSAYKVVEVSPVDETTLENALNRWTGEGWVFDRLEFVQQSGVRRPVIAYLFFVSEGTSSGEVEEASDSGSR